MLPNWKQSRFPVVPFSDSETATGGVVYLATLLAAIWHYMPDYYVAGWDCAFTTNSAEFSCQAVTLLAMF